MSVSLVTTIRADFRNGMGIMQLNDRASGLENKPLSNADIPAPQCPKKEPNGAETAGVAAPSQVMSRRIPRSILGLFS